MRRQNPHDPRWFEEDIDLSPDAQRTVQAFLKHKADPWSVVRMMARMLIVSAPDSIQNVKTLWEKGHPTEELREHAREFIRRDKLSIGLTMMFAVLHELSAQPRKKEDKTVVHWQCWQRVIKDIDFSVFTQNPNRYKYAARVATELQQDVLMKDNACGEALLESFLAMMCAVVALSMGDALPMEEKGNRRAFGLLQETGENEWFELLQKNTA